jgi:hypothetical protein
MRTRHPIGFGVARVQTVGVIGSVLALGLTGAAAAGISPTTQAVSAKPTVKAPAIKLSVAITRHPTVSDFRARPASLTWTGGAVTLSAKVSNARACTFSSTPPISGLPSRIACSGGTVLKHVKVPANQTSKPEVHRFNLSVTGTSTVKAASVTAKTAARPNGLKGVRSIVGEAGSYCAVLRSGGVDCWGDNTYGQLGNGTIKGPDGASGYDTPQAVTGITNAVSAKGDCVCD